MTHAQLQLTQVYIAMHETSDAAPAERERQLERALRSSAEAVALSGRCNDRGLIAITRFARAQLLHSTNRLQEAQRLAEEALKWFKKAEDPLGEARTLVLQGDVALDLGLKDEARALAEEARSLAQDLGAVAAAAEAEAAALLQRIVERSKVGAPVVQLAVQQVALQAGPTGTSEAAAPEASLAKPEPKGLDPAVVRAKVMDLTKNLMANDDELANDSPFMEAGMDSLSSVQLMSELGKHFQMAMSPSLVFDFPTVNALADHLVEESMQAAY